MGVVELTIDEVQTKRRPGAISNRCRQWDNEIQRHASAPNSATTKLKMSCGVITEVVQQHREQVERDPWATRESPADRPPVRRFYTGKQTGHAWTDRF